MEEHHLNLVRLTPDDLSDIKGILFPREDRFRQIIVTGPPGSGKSTLVRKLGGWPSEGYLDLGEKGWWRSPILTYRPREVHFGIPFVGFPNSLAVFEPEWLDHPTPIAFDRIIVPPEKGHFLAVDWRRKFSFHFLLIPAELTFRKRMERVKKGAYPVDRTMTLEHTKLQLAAYRDLAGFFHRSGMRVFVREDYQGEPMRIADDET